jgi:hypothetical protein
MKTTRHEKDEKAFVSSCENIIFSLFESRPELCGFTVKVDGDMVLSDLGLYPEPEVEDMLVICNEIRDTLLTLVDERPEARRLLAGRTFARAIH